MAQKTNPIEQYKEACTDMAKAQYTMRITRKDIEDVGSAVLENCTRSKLKRRVWPYGYGFTVDEALKEEKGKNDIEKLQARLDRLHIEFQEALGKFRAAEKERTSLEQTKEVQTHIKAEHERLEKASSRRKYLEDYTEF